MSALTHNFSVETASAIPSAELADYWFALRHKLFEQLNQRFHDSGLKQSDIAEKLGKSDARVSKWLRGRENITLRTMNDIARAMDCRLEVSIRPLADVNNRPNDLYDENATFKKSYPTEAATTSGSKLIEVGKQRGTTNTQSQFVVISNG